MMRPAYICDACDAVVDRDNPGTRCRGADPHGFDPPCFAVAYERDMRARGRRALRWVLALVGGAVLFSALAIWAEQAAQASDDGRYTDAPPLVKEWFNAQRNMRGEICCDETEARPVEAWGAGPGGYRVKINGRWHDVDPLALDLTRSITGEPLVWIYPKGAQPSTATIRCFIPGDQG